MCMIDDCDEWKFFREEERKAGKAHRCGECGRAIERGETHRYAVGAIDDHWYSYRTCAQCREASRWLVVACSGYLFTSVQEDLGEHVVGEEMYLRTAPLTRLYRWMLADWRDRSGTLRPVGDVKAVADSAIAAYRRQYQKATAA